MLNIENFIFKNCALDEKTKEMHFLCSHVSLQADALNSNVTNALFLNVFVKKITASRDACVECSDAADLR